MHATAKVCVSIVNKLLLHFLQPMVLAISRHFCMEVVWEENNFGIKVGVMNKIEKVLNKDGASCNI